MAGINQLAILLIGTKARVHTVVVRAGIAVVGGPLSLVRRVVLQNRRKPQGRHTQVCKVVQVLLQSFQVATMTQRWSIAVFLIGAHTFYLLLVVGTLCKAVRHQQVEHVTDVEALALVARHFALFQLVVHYLTLHLSLFILHLKCQFHRAGLRILQIQIHQQIVRRVEAHNVFDGNARIVSRHLLSIADAFAIHHQLHGWILQSHIPVGGVDTCDNLFGRCIHCHHVCNKNDCE